MTERSLKPGDHVSWNSPGGRATGKVVEKLVERTRIKGHKVAASPGEPQYLVQSENSGEQAVHKPEALRRD